MKCPNCDGRGAVQIAPNVKGLKRCPVCGGSGKTTEYDGLRKFWCDYKCEVCNGSGEIKEQTNEEWLRSCSFNELARVLYCMIINGERIRPDLGYIKRWLKEKHGE